MPCEGLVWRSQPTHILQKAGGGEGPDVLSKGPDVPLISKDSDVEMTPHCSLPVHHRDPCCYC